MKRACVLVVVLSGCFNPDDLIPIRGSVDAPGQRVELLRSPRCDDAWKVLKETNAGDDGVYGFEVFRAQVQTLSNMRPQCLRAQTTFASGTRTASTVRALALTADIPKFVDWKPELSLDGGALVFNALDAGVFAVTHVAELRSSDGGLVWTQTDQPLGESGSNFAPINIDERVLREFDATLSLVAKYGIKSTPGAEPAVTQQEAVTVHPVDSFDFAATMIPLSRGCECDELPSPCALTDGRLAETVFPHFEATRSVFTIRFPAPSTPSLLVARDLAFGGGSEYLLDENGYYVLAAWNTLHVAGLTADGRELELGTTKLFYDVNQVLDPGEVPSFRSPGHWFVMPLSSPEPVVGVRLRSTAFSAIQEISIH